jgi:hypothetical protein
MADQTQISVRLHEAALEALVEMAAAAGLEAADYAQTILLRHVEPAIKRRNLAAILLAEAEIKLKASELARRLSPPRKFDPHVTLKVFQAIRQDADLRALYLAAIGGGEGFERGNPLKARVNRAIGSTVKAALGASSTDADGRTTKVEITGEFCFSYTLLFAH